MSITKKPWKKPVLTKVELEFDKEMAGNCHGSSQPSSNNPQGCKHGGRGSCWTRGN